jgi:hypothetical protein
MTIIGLTGYARVGKDTVAKSLQLRGGFVPVSFTDKLNELLLALDLKVDYTGSDAPDFLSGHYPYYLDNLVAKFGWEWCKDNTTAREHQQYIGTEVCRTIFGDDVWVNAARPVIHGLMSDGKNVVITNVRFQNECDFVHSLGGKVVRVVRDGFAPANDHISDTGIDKLNVDGMFFNNTSIEEIGTKVSALLKELGITV